MKINKEELFLITNILLELLNDKIFVEIQEDFYWDISQKEIYNPYEDPKNLTLGQLSDDWQELKRILNGTHIPVGYDLKRLSNILRVISSNYP